MPDTSRNRRRLIRFIAQEVLRDQDTVREIPHFDKSAVAIILQKLNAVLDVEENSHCAFVNWVAWSESLGIWPLRPACPSPRLSMYSAPATLPPQQQVADRMIERRQDYAMLVNSGERVGRVNGLAVLGANSGLSDFSGIMLPVEAW